MLSLNLVLTRNLLRFAARSLTRSVLRSGLTALSLAIGVAAVVAMVGIGNGAKARVQQSLASLDANRLVLGARMKMGDDGWKLGFPGPDGLNIDDYYAIRTSIPGVIAASPELALSGAVGKISARGRSTEANIVGIDVAGFILDSHVVLRGAIFGRTDVRGASAVCVVSESAASMLFPDADPIGESLQIKNAPFRIIGVVADKAAVSDPGAIYRGAIQVFIPFTSLLQRLDRAADDNMRIALRAVSPEALGELTQRVSDLMEQRRGNRKVEFVTFTVVDSVEAYTNSSRTLALLLAFISAISLVVGGIGVMNVMLMNVTERTREIGIRVAIGARNSDVLMQFLLEAVILSLIGGVAGALLGVGLAFGVGRWNDWPVLITAASIVQAFLLSAAIGVFFGYYPARQAARLRPIQALRAE